MAKIISPVWSIIRGSIAGTTYLSGPSGQIIARQRTAPSNPQTHPQGDIRSIMQTAAALWKEVLTSADRSDWADWAKTVVYSGPTGSYSPTGQNMFIGCYALARYCEGQGYGSVAAGTDPPTIAGLLDTGGYFLKDRVSAGTGFQLDVVNYAAEAVTIFIQKSNAWEASKNYFTGPWVHSRNEGQDVAASTSASLDIDVPEDGKKYFVRVRAVAQEAPNRIGAPIILSGISSTVP